MSGGRLRPQLLQRGRALRVQPARHVTVGDALHLRLDAHGEVGPLETEPKSYVIYKVISKDTLPKEQVKAEITREISQQKFNNALKTAIDSTHAQFNEQYFGEPISVASPAKPPALPARSQSR